MAQKTDPIATIMLTLKTTGIVPADFDVAGIEDEYALMAALRQHTKGAQVRLMGEDIGADDDACEDYVAFLKRFAKASGGAIAYEGLASEMDGDTVHLRFQSAGQVVHWSFEQESDHLSEEFLDHVIAHSKACETGEFIDLQHEDLCVMAFVPKEVARLLYAHEIIPTSC